MQSGFEASLSRNSNSCAANSSVSEAPSDACAVDIDVSEALQSHVQNQGRQTQMSRRKRNKVPVIPINSDVDTLGQSSMQSSGMSSSQCLSDLFGSRLGLSARKSVSPAAGRGRRSRPLNLDAPRRQ